jgi:uncharacterized protein (DUF486 family)
MKTIQEIITLGVFAVFSVIYLQEQFRWNLRRRVRFSGLRSILHVL